MQQQNKVGSAPNVGTQAKGSLDDVAKQAKDTLSSATESVSEVARDAYEQGERFVQEARERYPEAARYYRESSDLVRHSAENPLITLLVGVGLGFALARVADAIWDGSRDDVPDYARRR